uniref:Flap structure-specific endonuclease 1 n=2 Tax=Hippocampus comes TaxID=109280 RepID=A0A3Q3E5C3_HIPCM
MAKNKASRPFGERSFEKRPPGDFIQERRAPIGNGDGRHGHQIAKLLLLLGFYVNVRGQGVLAMTKKSTAFTALVLNARLQAPCEAEASCAALVKAGKVFATATEDMDGLTFGTNVLLRHLTASEAKKLPVQEFHFSRILQDINLTNEQFIDLCILLGCDYCGTIKGIGPKRAIDLIRQHGSIEEILENIDPNKHPAPDNWLYKEARELFLKPEVVDCSAVELKWNEPDEGGLLRFMCEEKQFSEDRIRNGCKKIVKSRQGSTQGRLDAFFSVSGSLSSKRKEPEVKGSAKKKLKTGAAAGKFKKAK